MLPELSVHRIIPCWNS